VSARQEGYDAYKAGKSLDDNPYDEPHQGSIFGDYHQWEEGWFEAQAEERRAPPHPDEKKP
jgi:ribosome modulation factor